MAVLSILIWPDPVLAKVCTPVDARETAVSQLVDDLFDSMHSAQGRGLAAPQIGVLQRVFFIDVTWKDGEADPMAFINPQITGHSEATHVVMEQCLSIPQLPMPVTRPAEIDLSWDTIQGERTSAHFSGDAARCIQHEFDHLDGLVTFDHQSPEDIATLYAAYVP